jgi:iron complex outermembrane receptor protein
MVAALLATTAAIPALAQDASGAGGQPVPPTASQPVAGDSGPGETIVVTGTLLRDRTLAAPSPITVVQAETLDRRGLPTIQDAIQTLVSINGPALTNNFSANGAFASGASGASLRGLTTNSTLVLFDGLRASYYPLADDGTRNFVDLNTVPDDIVERIEVLRDGASSLYGADAIAGVINIITKRQITGVQGRAEGGVSGQGIGSTYRLSLSAGVGDLSKNGFNAYISGFYYRSQAVFNRQLPSPFNSADQQSIGGPNNIQNGLVGGVLPENTGALQTNAFQVRPANIVVDPVTGARTNVIVPGSRFQQLEAGCRGFPSYVPTAADLAAAGNSATARVLCQQDDTFRYGQVTPELERFGVSGKFTAVIGDSHEAYAEFNFLQTRSSVRGGPVTLRRNANTGIFFPRFSLSTGNAPFAPGSFAITLPVYVCPQGRGDASGLNTGCTDQNGNPVAGARLNPNNPFAANGQLARLQGAFPQDTLQETVNRTYRGAIGFRGPVTERLTYALEGVAMRTDLDRPTYGYPRIQNLLDAVAQGTFNFVDPTQNSRAVLNQIAPPTNTPASSELYQVRGSLNWTLPFELPGGRPVIAGGGEFRYEAVNSPSANSDINGPTQRYLVLNAFGAAGNRTIGSGFFELGAPILKQFTVNVSGRYDSYSTGQSAFVPKVGAVINPFRQLTLRGTYSEGFRIPSFGEANSLPTTGFVNTPATAFPDSFLAQYGCSQANFQSRCPTYIRTAAYGLTTLGTPGLQPENSRSWTVGGTIRPLRNLSINVDYYNIEKTNAIASQDTGPALAAYYNNTAPPAGIRLVPGAPSPDFPNARPVLGFIESGYVNANRINTDGIEFGADWSVRLPYGIKYSFSGQASYIFNLSTTIDGVTQRYAGTLGNYNLTAGTGTPRWRALAVSTLDFGTVATTGTVNYFGGYNQSAADQGGTPGDCGLNPGYGRCNVPAYVTFDVNVEFKMDDRVRFYVTALNVLDALPPVDTATYGAYLYNTVQAGNGILGRYFRAGARFAF